MANNNAFEHLPLPMVLTGTPKLNGGSRPSPRTDENRNNRNTYGRNLKLRCSELSRFWNERKQDRIDANLPALQVGIPILLEIDPNVDLDFLRGLGFEIISENSDGFIIVASEDVNLEILNRKIEDFIANIKARCNSPAKIYALCEDTDRLNKILSPQLQEKWDNLVMGNLYIVDIGVSCTGRIELPQMPRREENESDDHYILRQSRWQMRFNDAYMLWDDIKSEREDTISNFVREYNGEIVTFIDGSSDLTVLPDSFPARLKISGACLKDIALNLPYIFEIYESDEISCPVSIDVAEGDVFQIDFITPDVNDPKICVIDSGIQEQHQYLSASILGQDSKSYLTNNISVSDEVRGGGHGTRVAGAIMYANDIPHEGNVNLHCWLRNIRVLDENNQMPMEIYTPKLAQEIVKHYHSESDDPSKIFNQSIGTKKQCELKHMSAWAVEIDLQSYNNDILFVQAAGNIKDDDVKSYILAGYNYPEYLSRELCRVCDPAQSLQALTVGSISKVDYATEDTIALGQKDQVSSFSRSGPGIWDVIKPDVVEYGGTKVISKEGEPRFTIPQDVCPELIRKSPEGPAFAKDNVGTSFSTPKVTNIVAEVQKVLPNSPALLYRALIAQSARWPEWTAHLEDSFEDVLRTMGYGLPDVTRATRNNDYRITLLTEDIKEIGEGEAHVYRIPIPEELSTVGEDYNILVEITLSYAAMPRRTRRSVKRYLSTWLDWSCSRSGESFETFGRRIYETGSRIEDDGNFSWFIGDATNHGRSDGFSNKNGTLQKDWTIVKSNQLSDAFCIAVRGHKGWGSLFKAKYSLAVSFEAIDQDIPIYEPIRTMVEVEVENTEIELEMQE